MKLEKLAQMTKEIDQVLDFITKVANKTKLIGLNASIEAARLGNAGRGFTIVSGEIQKLSEDTKSTTMQINKLNGKINEKITTTEKNSEIPWVVLKTSQQADGRTFSNCTELFSTCEQTERFDCGQRPLIYSFIVKMADDEIEYHLLRYNNESFHGKYCRTAEESHGNFS